MYDLQTATKLAFTVAGKKSDHKASYIWIMALALYGEKIPLGTTSLLGWMIVLLIFS